MYAALFWPFRLFFLLLVLVGLTPASQAQQIAFPGAEGYGKFTIGGRGGQVYAVTTLADSGPGSLREAVEVEGPRTIVFRVSGIITLESELRITYPYITIAGQTAPGDGICIRDFPLIIDTDQVIIRHLRIRLGDGKGNDADAISGRFFKHVIVDHVSASWSIDEVMSIYHCDSTTVQWCIISESLHNSKHAKGKHGFGGIWGGNYVTYHHNLFAHHTSRNPRFASGSKHTDFRNNVIYNWGYNSAYGGEAVQRGKEDQFNSTFVNIVANYYKPGPATQPGIVSHRIINPSARNIDDYGKWYVTQNYMVGNSTVSANNWNGGVQPTDGNEIITRIKMDAPFAGTMSINEESPEDAYLSVLKHAGASRPRRDAVDIRIIEETRKGVATYEGTSYKSDHALKDSGVATGIIDSQGDVGGWPEYTAGEAPEDSDRDGMPDTWEQANGLNKADPSDRNITGPNGFTMLEVYLYSLTDRDNTKSSNGK